MIGYATPGENDPKQPPKSGAVAALGLSSVILWSFLAIIMLPLLAGSIGVLLGAVPAYFAIATACILLLVTGNSARLARRRRVRIVLGYLETAVSTNLPLSPILNAAAKSETGGARKRLLLFREAVEDGSPLGDALLIAVPHTPRRIIDLVNAAEGSGRLPAVLPQLIELPDAARDSDSKLGLYSVYSLLVLLVITGVTTVLTIFVFPKFMQIFSDFHTPVPPLTHFVFAIGGTLAPILCLVTASVLLIVEGGALRQVLTSGRPRANPLVEFTDSLIWIMPVFGTQSRDRGLADAFHVMADAVSAGRPLPDAVREATMPHLNSILRRRIGIMAEQLALGTPLYDAAAVARLPAIVCGLLSTAGRVGNMPQTLRFLAGHYESRFSRIDLLLRGAAIPAVVLGLGTIVLLVGLSMFQPIVDLIETVELYTKMW